MSSQSTLICSCSAGKFSDTIPPANSSFPLPLPTTLPLRTPPPTIATTPHGRPDSETLRYVIIGSALGTGLLFCLLIISVYMICKCGHCTSGHCRVHRKHVLDMEDNPVIWSDDLLFEDNATCLDTNFIGIGSCVVDHSVWDLHAALLYICVCVCVYMYVCIRIISSHVAYMHYNHATLRNFVVVVFCPTTWGNCWQVPW